MFRVLRSLHVSFQPAAACAVAVVLMIPVTGVVRASDVACDEPFPGVPDLRIFRSVDRLGRATVVLTNLDDEGNLLRGAAEEEAWMTAPRPTAAAVAPPPEVSPAARTADDEPVAVRVVVRGSEGDREARDREIEVTGDGRGGTTIIVNVDASPAAPVAPAPPALSPVAWPIVVVGGLVGPFRYPDRLPFLGYGPTTSSPGMFGGLGLNASNGFGLRGATPCREGFDCLFGPRPSKP